MASYVKAQLKASREALSKKDYGAALEAADNVLNYEHDHYNALVFRGLALLGLQRDEEGESAYRKATQVKPDELLAWQGLEKYYTDRHKPDQAIEIIQELLKRHSQDATKTAENLQRILDLRRKEEDDKQKLADALSNFLPSSPYYNLLSTLPEPDQSNPVATTTFEAQMNVYVRPLQIYAEVIDLLEKLEQRKVEQEVDKRRLRLDRAKRTREALVNEVGSEVWSVSQLPALYDAVLSHPLASDEVRRDAERSLLRYRYKLLLSLPNPSSAASKMAAQGPRGTAATHATASELKQQKASEEAQMQAKASARDQVGEMAFGMVTIQVSDELAWKIRFDWEDCETLYEFPPVQVRTFLDLFRFEDKGAESASALVLASRALLLSVEDGIFLQAEKERALQRDLDDGGAATEGQDALSLAISAIEADPTCLFAHRIAATLYLLDRDYQSAVDVATAALALVRKTEADAAVALTNVKQGLNALMATALTHLHPPQNHLRALRYADSVLARNSQDGEVLMAKAYMKQAAEDWSQAKSLFAQVASILPERPPLSEEETEEATAASRRLLSFTTNPALEARGEIAWCDVKLRNLEEAKVELKDLIDRLDSSELAGVTREQRARTWWRHGQCLWLMGEGDDDMRLDASNAFASFITALKRFPSFAPAFTSLGIYYSEVSPPDLDRSAKCFQKAFELDPKESEAARRLAQSFAEEREWDLVEVVARRVIKGEGGDEVLSGARASKRLHVSKNTWAWRALGSVELQNQKFEESIVAFQIALRSEPEDASLWHLIGEAYARSGRHAASLRALAKAEEICSTSQDASAALWEVRYTSADVHRQLADYDQSIAIFQQIVSDDSDRIAVRVNLAETLLLSGRRSTERGYPSRARVSLVEAIKQGSHVLKSSATLRSAWKVTADSFFELSRISHPQSFRGKVASAIEGLMPLLQDQGADSKVPSVKLGELGALSAPGQDDAAGLCLAAALHVYKIIVVLNAASEHLAGPAWFDMAVALSFLSGQTSNISAMQQAVGCVKQALQAEPENGRFWLILANLMLEHNIRLSQHAFIRAIECTPKSPIPWSGLGFLYLQHGDVELANEAFIRAQTLDPNWAQAWVGQGFVAAEHQDAKSAKVLFQHAFGLCEGSLLEADHQCALAAFASFRSPHPPSHVLLYSPAFALSCYLAAKPQDATVLHLAALFSERLGEHALSVERIERAANLLEAEYEATESHTVAVKYAVAQVNLGRIRLAQHQSEEALAAFEGGLSLLEDEAEDEEEEETCLSATNVQLARASAFLGSALCHYFSGEQSLADKSFESALVASSAEAEELHMAQVHIACVQARCKVQTGDFRSASDSLLEILAEDPESIATINVLAAIGLAFDDEELLDAALSEAKQLPREQLQAVDPLGTVPLLLAMSRFWNGEDDPALDHLKIAVQDPHATVETHLQLVTALARRANGQTNDELKQRLAGLKLVAENQLQDRHKSSIVELVSLIEPRQGSAVEALRHAPWNMKLWLNVELSRAAA